MAAQLEESQIDLCQQHSHLGSGRSNQSGGTAAIIFDTRGATTRLQPHYTLRCTMLRAPLRASLPYQSVFSKLAQPTKRHASNLSRHTHHSSPSTQQTDRVFLTQPSPQRRRKTLHTPVNVTWFHSTRTRQGVPFLPFLIAAFKVTTTVT